MPLKPCIEKFSSMTFPFKIDLTEFVDRVSVHSSLFGALRCFPIMVHSPTQKSNCRSGFTVSGTGCLREERGNEMAIDATKNQAADIYDSLENNDALP